MFVVSFSLCVRILLLFVVGGCLSAVVCFSVFAGRCYLLCVVCGCLPC